MKTITIAKNDAGQRLDKFLTKAFPHLPQSMLYKSIRTKRIKRNGKRWRHFRPAGGRATYWNCTCTTNF